MSGRVCLLCEKPLGRVWLGAGEDFCSREHRNQYRLRRGMDRLLEANKMANLMRRRENPKALTLFREIGEDEIPRHGFFEPRFVGFDGEPLVEHDWKLGGGMQPATSLAADTAFLDGLAIRRPLPLPARLPGEAPPLGQRTGMAALPRRPRQPYPRLVAAGPAAVNGHGSHGALQPRDTGITWKSALGLYLDPHHHLDTPSFRPYQEPHGCRQSGLSGPRGYSLRVSQGAGFRIQTPRLRTLQLELKPPRVPECADRTEPPPPARAGRLEALWAAGPAAVRTVPTIPKLKSDPPPARMKWPGIISPSGDEPFEGRELEVRVLDGVFTGFPPAFPPPSRHGGRDRARIRRLRPILAGDAPEPIVTTVPIGCITDGVDARPGAPHEARNNVEERFEDGWKNWSGGFASWTVDAAGARTGSLALFTPSMEWRDYELEFFTRIENHSVSWVYRAASLNDYYMASLTALPDKGFALTRRTVLRGKPGAALTAPLTILPNPKSAYLVRMRIAGSQFSLWIEGQKIETWTDNRFSMGGAGFLGAPDDRARIYWVRFYPGPAKESSRK